MGEHDTELELFAMLFYFISVISFLLFYFYYFSCILLIQRFLFYCILFNFIHFCSILALFYSVYLQSFLSHFGNMEIKFVEMRAFE